ncbi:hypothetical protein [Paractinoplanes rishiriensis]|uniref:Uncharacterized protein n=1 Tax=Paractinoplanes rishiriensis TaxID=1050105 RepID=A0A919MXR4_9ACTN|nr:hypothetical protein [Actinoplanes rishiriensis]GIE98904.1 hypothetical protein Ari01nite_63690 [Actinoplanes rishiriensis]
MGDMLSDLHDLKNRSRRLAHGGAWLPALALAALPLLSIALYRHPFAPVTEIIIEYPYWAGLPHQQRAALLSYLFWMVLAPLAFVLVAQWYRYRERRHGVRVPWRVPVAAGSLGLLALVALFAAPTGTPALGFGTNWWQGLLTPLLGVAVAAFALGLVERSPAIVLAGAWMAAVAWQFCATGQVGGLLGWQTWLLGGGSGPGLGGQVTLLGMDRPAPALILMSLPLVVVGLFRLRRS